ncbi:hypothetical protein JG687_00019413 [Phytophthora cactorum]|uniref:Uncharacterized protein n=1 Tax=Phytophthora cactorum TaxID=29920 RepID=A0A8T1TKN5_9STRA|nr:hypothetical protein JG687_00019413 [Phytophthora cactorum]
MHKIATFTGKGEKCGKKLNLFALLYVKIEEKPIRSGSMHLGGYGKDNQHEKTLHCLIRGVS